MHITITGRNLEVTSALRDYAQEKIGKLEEFFNNIQKIEVVLEAKSIDNVDRRQVAEIRAWLAGKKMIQATEAGRDMYAALDMAVDEAKRQIERHKKKHVNEQRRKAEKLKIEAREAHPAEASAGPVMVKLNRFSNKPMNFDEAREELKVMGQDFIAFRNTETKEINVVRKNKSDFELLRPVNELLPEEAIDRLKTSGENLIIFNNKSTSAPSVIFRRKSGNFGLIEPEI